MSESSEKCWVRRTPKNEMVDLAGRILVSSIFRRAWGKVITMLKIRAHNASMRRTEQLYTTDLERK